MYFKPEIVGKFIRHKRKPLRRLKVIDIFKSGCNDYNYALCRHHHAVIGALMVAEYDIGKLREHFRPNSHLFAAGLKYLEYDVEKMEKLFMWAHCDDWEPAILDKSAISQILVKQYR